MRIAFRFEKQDEIAKELAFRLEPEAECLPDCQIGVESRI
jgi:hypothetical protein